MLCVTGTIEQFFLYGKVEARFHPSGDVLWIHQEQHHWYTFSIIVLWVPLMKALCVCVCVWKWMPGASIRVISLKLLTIVRYIILASVMSVCVCVCGGEKNAMSQCLCITVTSLKLLTIVRYIILSSVMSMCVCVCERECHEPVSV